MNEALCSILYKQDQWYFDTEGRSIKFNEDGTGELEWKSIEPRYPSQDPSSPRTTKPRCLGSLSLEIRLTKRLPQWTMSYPLSQSTIINEGSLIDDAFQPKSYTITIEQGNFIEPCYVGCQIPNGQRYALRLLFDKSPYPPRSEWREPEKGPDGGPFWEHKEFVSRSSSELNKQGRAMNDSPAKDWKSCIIL